MKHLKTFENNSSENEPDAIKELQDYLYEYFKGSGYRFNIIGEFPNNCLRVEEGLTNLSITKSYDERFGVTGYLKHKPIVGDDVLYFPYYNLEGIAKHIEDLIKRGSTYRETFKKVETIKSEKTFTLDDMLNAFEEGVTCAGSLDGVPHRSFREDGKTAFRIELDKLKEEFKKKLSN